MVQLLSFADAISDSADCTKRHLLLGNGFSIGCRADIFHYASLFEEADFSSIQEVAAVFAALETHDFEVAIRALESGARLVGVYRPDAPETAELMRSHAASLKDILVTTIADNHPDVPGSIADARFWACRRFLNCFLGGNATGQVYTLNYDLLLYWALMHDDDATGEALSIAKNDSFGNDEEDPDADYVVWQGESAAHSARVLFLHGALHLFDAGSELKKYTWVRKGKPLIEQAREAINENAFPLFVAEGTSAKKKEKIRHNAYLYQCFKQLVANANTKAHCFFIYGHSLAENDEHILSRFARGKCKKLYVSVFGEQNTPSNQAIIARANELAGLRHSSFPLDVQFFDSASANIWD